MEEIIIKEAVQSNDKLDFFNSKFCQEFNGVGKFSEEYTV